MKLIQFFKEAGEEFNKVSWPTREELTRHTIIVLVFLAIFAAVIAVVDLAFNAGYAQLVSLAPEKPVVTETTNSATTNPLDIVDPNEITITDEEGNPVEGVTITPVTGDEATSTEASN